MKSNLRPPANSLPRDPPSNGTMLAESRKSRRRLSPSSTGRQNIRRSLPRESPAPPGNPFFRAFGDGENPHGQGPGRETGLNFISISVPILFSKWLGESEKALHQIFKKAKQSAPCILFFDEIDTLDRPTGRNRGGRGRGTYGQPVLQRTG